MEPCLPCGAELWGYEEIAAKPPGELPWVRAVWSYRGTGGRLVRRAKFARDPLALAFLARGMLRLLKAGEMPGGRPRGPWLVVPVPLSARKRRRRGFNQAQDLAQRVAERMGWELGTWVLRRVRDTTALGRVRREEREALLLGAFELGKGQRRRVLGRRILLVDDVVTTGATMRACASVLLDGGASRVLGLASCAAGGESGGK